MTKKLILLCVVCTGLIFAQMPKESVGGGGAGGANPAGSGSEVNHRSDGTTFGAVTNSSVSGGSVIWKAIQTITLDAIGETTTVAFAFQNTTAATAGNQQFAPALYFRSQAWDANGSDSDTIEWFVEGLANQQGSGTAGIVPNFRIGYKLDGGSYVPWFHSFNHDDAYDADFPLQNLFWGIGSGNPTGMTSASMANIGIGRWTLNSLTSGNENLAFGNGAGRYCTSCYWNTLIGQEAGGSLTAGYENVCVGQGACQTQLSSHGMTTGEQNTHIGVLSGFPSHMQWDRSIAIGYNARVDGHDTGALGDGGMTWSMGGYMTPLSTLLIGDVDELASESLSNGGFADGTDWSVANDFAITGGKLVYTHSSGSGWAQQTTGNMTIALVVGRHYVVTYSPGSHWGDVACVTSVPMTGSRQFSLTQSGTKTIHFQANDSPPNFEVSCTSSSGGMTLDNFSIKEVIGGDLEVLGHIVPKGSISTTGLTAAVSTASIVPNAVAGLYRVSGYMHTTTPADGACSSDVDIGWTYNSDAKVLEVVADHDQNADEEYSQIPPTIVRLDVATSVTYAISLDVDADCTNATFDAYLVAERIQ